MTISRGSQLHFGRVLIGGSARPLYPRARLGSSKWWAKLKLVQAWAKRAHKFKNFILFFQFFYSFVPFFYELMRRARGAFPTSRFGSPSEHAHSTRALAHLDMSTSRLFMSLVTKPTSCLARLPPFQVLHLI